MLIESRMILFEKVAKSFTHFGFNDTMRIIDVINIMFKAKEQNEDELTITLPKEWMKNSVVKILLENKYIISEEMHQIYFITKPSI